MSKTEIAWTEETWNPVRGCKRVSPGCEHCYAEAMAARIVRMGGYEWIDGAWREDPKKKVNPAARRTADKYKALVRINKSGEARWTGVFAFDEEKLDEPLRRKTPTVYFVNSMSDLFGEGLTNEQIAAVFGVMAACPQHTFQVLTKRPARAVEWVKWTEHGRRVFDWVLEHPTTCGSFGNRHGWTWPLPNVWLLVSAERQKEADERIPLLMRCPAVVRGVSAEPLLESMNLTAHLSGLGWVVGGGESGHGARPCDVEWLRDLARQCKAAGVPYFNKQLGASPILRNRWDVSDERFRLLDASGWTEHDGPPWLADKKGADPSEWPEDLCVREYPRGFVPPKSRSLPVVGGA